MNASGLLVGVLASGLQGAVITAFVSARTSHSGAPDCYQSSTTGAFVSCHTGLAGAVGQTSGSFDDSRSTGGISLFLSASRFAGDEDARADGSVTLDAIFVETGYSGPLTGLYVFNLGQAWQDPPVLTITQGGTVLTPQGQGYAMVVSQVESGVPFEVILNLYQSVFSPDEISVGSVQMDGFTANGVTILATGPPATVPEPGTSATLLGGLAVFTARGLRRRVTV